jgi:hypothetical protein
MKISQIITFFFLIIPGLTFAQQDLQKDSFPKTIHYLSTTYLDNMQKVSNQTNNDLIHMSQDLSVSISIMLKQNVHTIQQSTSQLNHSITTQLLPEMKALREKK